MGAQGRQACQLVLSIEAAEGAVDRLAAAMAAVPLASAVIAPVGERGLVAAMAAPLVARAQKGGVAALVRNDPAVARALRADGVHLGPVNDVVTAFGEAREILGSRAIVGVEPDGSRDDAMTVAERGADYVAFGLRALSDEATAWDERLHMVSWWAEIFEVPCIAMDVTSVDEAAALAAAGADFVSLSMPTAMALGDVGAWMQGILKAVQGPLGLPRGG